jgi:histone deacetylase 6
MTGVVAFIANNPVRPVSNPSGPWLANWYRDNSRVFVSKTHQLWQKAEQKKLSKRYGRVESTEETGLHAMMMMHRKDVTEWILEKCLDVEDGDGDGDGDGEGGDVVMDTTE